jgi:hypothetical protein
MDKLLPLILTKATPLGWACVTLGNALTLAAYAAGIAGGIRLASKLVA